MTALDRTTYPSAILPRADVATRLKAIAGNLFRAVFNRRHIGNLAELSDYHLADIGLQRSDLHQAAITPLASDPTAALTRLRHARAHERLARKAS